MVATGEGSIRVPISKRDDEKRQVYGFAAVVAKADGTPIVDHQGDIIPLDELRSLAHSAIADGGEGKAGVNHNSSQDQRGNLVFGKRGSVVESVIIDKAFRDAHNMPDGPDGWWVGLQLNHDEDWARVKSGELSELSIKVMAERVPV